MEKNEKIKVGIGFATGRKIFQQVLRTDIESWNESGLVENKLVSLNVFIAYDLTYKNTEVADFTNIHPDLLDKIESY